jgi:hypothetical protein
MQTTGKIAVVQEERFRLINDQGQGLLLTLSRSASATAEDLWRFHRQATEVLVSYTGQPNTESGVASQVRPA